MHLNVWSIKSTVLVFSSRLRCGASSNDWVRYDVLQISGHPLRLGGSSCYQSIGATHCTQVLLLQLFIDNYYACVIYYTSTIHSQIITFDDAYAHHKMGTRTVFHDLIGKHCVRPYF